MLTLPCPSCGHRIENHMREKHRGWESRHKPYCNGYPDRLSCGCGVTQEEIVDYHVKKAAGSVGERAKEA